MEGWVDLSTAVKVHSPCSRLYIAAAVEINTNVRGEILTLVQFGIYWYHIAVRRAKNQATETCTRTGFWHCLHSMQTRVYVTVECPPVCPSHRYTAAVVAGRFAAECPASRTYRSTAAGAAYQLHCCRRAQQQWRRSSALSSKCGQCHVDNAQHTHTCLMALCPGLPGWAGTRDSEWQWHKLGRMQVCTMLQTDNHASTPPLSFLQAGCPSCHLTNSVKPLKANWTQTSCYRKYQQCWTDWTWYWINWLLSGNAASFNFSITCNTTNDTLPTWSLCLTEQL